MTKEKARLSLCYGTRPQVVKASVLLDALQQDWAVTTIDTGQHYEWRLNGVHYEQLGIRPPDQFLEVGSASHAAQTAEVMVRAAGAFEETEPEVVVVIGDTNSTLGCALAAAKMRLPVVHVEAGMRAADFLMPEEINRRAVDEISSLLLAPSRRAEAFLKERVSEAQSVVFTGDVARDVLEKARSLPGGPRAPWESVGISPPFVLATLHRAEITSDPEAVEKVIDELGRVPFPVFFPAHPRTVAAFSLTRGTSHLPSNVVLAEPVGYLEMIAWISKAEAVVTDSGGLQREAYWLGTPCITLRSETEWVETVEEGANVLVDPRDPSRLPEILTEREFLGGMWGGLAYGDGTAGDRVREEVLKTFA